MKKTKMQKGITLIALIITIVVLLILATVTIGSVRESGIIGHAQNASSEYTIAQEKERIALAYSEYQIQKTLNSEIEPDTLSVDEATIEPIGNFGWKVTYKDTGNVYGINSKGEYDDAITMIIEASEATGVSVNKFIIFEDRYAITENAENANVSGYTKIPERYVFYNWAEVTDEERKVLELYNPTTSTESVENASNRMFILDTNGDGKLSYVDSGKTGFENSDYYEICGMLSGILPEKMTDDIHDFYAKICYYQDTGENVYNYLGEKTLSEVFYCFLWDWSLEFGHVNGQTALIDVAFGRNDTFRNTVYTQHVYYTSPRYEADFE